MRTLVFGGRGMLGRAVVERWTQEGAVAIGLGHAEADITDAAKVRTLVEEHLAGSDTETEARLIVNCAAFTKVDDCETQRDTAFAVNGAAVGHLADAAASVGAGLVHVSSDYVFDGTASDPIAEDAPTGPSSVYGASKLAGEQQALRYDRALVVRASWLFGPGGPNFAATIRRLLAGGMNPLKVVDDQVGRPTYTPFVARALWDLAGDVVTGRLRGVVHYGNDEPVSWHGFATEIARRLAPEVDVLPVPTSEFPRPAPRPGYSVLDVSRFESHVGRKVESWSDGLVEYLDSLGDDTPY